MKSLIVGVLLVAGIGVASLFDQLGLSIGASVALGFAIVGLITFAVERGFGNQTPAFGATFMVIGGLAGVAAMVQAVPQVNGWVIGIGTLVVEIGLIVGLVKLYRVLLVRASGALRRRAAARHGWQYRRQAEVPVPGPRTAPRLTAVPNDARVTTGRDVIQGTTNGMTFTVYDRVRSGERKALAQTVCLVHLPLALPYLNLGAPQFLGTDDPLEAFATSSGIKGPDRELLREFFHGDTDDRWTDDERLAQLLSTPALRAAAARLSRQPWIENAFLCAIANTGLTTGAPVPQVEKMIEELTQFAAGLPWQQLTLSRD